MNIILIGFKACGKTTTGRALADLTGRLFIDSDTLLEDLFFEQDGSRLNCREIYARFGRTRMRELETEALRRLTGKEQAVVATGGGVVLRKINLSLLKAAGLLVFLDAPLPVLEQRLQSQVNSPLFREKTVSELHLERYPLYLAAADIHYVPDMERQENPAQLAKSIHDLVMHI